MTSIEKPRVPFEVPIPGGMCLGKQIIVEGTVPQSSLRFDVNLLCQSGDIALNIAPKFRENCVVTNNVKHMTWGPEERKGPLPIFPGQTFQLIIICEEDSFKISFNGEYFGEFNHRVPFTKITDFGVEGEVIVYAVHFDQDGSQVKNTASTASYGFQPGASSAPNSGPGGGLYPSVPPEFSPDSNNPGRGAFPPSGPSYPQGPGRFPTSGPDYPQGPAPFPTTGPGYTPGQGPYAPSGPSYPQGPGQYPSSGPGYPQGPGQYPPSGPGYPQGRGSYPGSGPSYPQGPGSYPGSGPSYPQGPSNYPQNPGYGQDPYPQMPGQGTHGKTKQKSSKSNFLNQAGMAIAGVLGPVLLAKGLRKATSRNQNPQGTHDPNQGRQDFLGQAAGTLAGILGGSGLSGYGTGPMGAMGPTSTTRTRPGGILDQAGSILAGVFGNRSVELNIFQIKAAKKQRKAQKKALKYGLPIAGAGLGAYALHKGLKKGFKRSSSSSSSSSSD
ncbi:hypothetical protein RUM44_008247 [Polyplax serrata]|uniref:Galectin n=1 Tax=Polyplax serrata TaxID=468196 RepID=A0ABR1BC70_POLSC